MQLNHMAVFLDRDGTINEEAGHINHIDRFRLYPWSAGAIRRLNEAGIKAVVVTNQSGVARGMFPETLVDQVHARMCEELRMQNARLDGIYYCPHHPEGSVRQYRLDCDCRKPRVGLIRRASGELLLDPGCSYVIGDKYSDLETGFAVGAKGILVLTGYGRGEWEFRRAFWQRAPDFVAADLAEAVDWAIRQSGPHSRRTVKPSDESERTGRAAPRPPVAAD